MPTIFKSNNKSTVKNDIEDTNHKTSIAPEKRNMKNNRLQARSTTRDEKNLRKEGIREGIKENVKDRVKTEEKVKDKLQVLSSHKDTMILKVTTFFPFDFFPDTLVIDATKVSITAKRFFATERVTVLHFKDITEVELETSLFLANLTITYLPRLEGVLAPRDALTYKIRLLKRKDAIRAQHIIKGILIAKREGVEITKLSKEEIEKVIKHLGEQNVEI